MNAPLVSILIVAWNSGADLARCLAALDRQTFTDFEVVLLDNASSDGAVEAAMEAAGDGAGDGAGARPWLRVERSEVNLGFAAGNNRAAQSARGRYLVTLNPDAFAEPDWLALLMAAAERHPEAGSIGSTQLVAADPALVDGAGDPYTIFGAAWRGGKDRPNRPAPEGEVFGVCAAAALYRRDAFEAVGGFCERFFCYYEDVDLAVRLRLAGWRAIQTPMARVHHVGSGSAPSGFVLRHATRNRIWTLMRGMPGPFLLLGLPLCLMLALAAALVGVARGQATARLSAIAEAVGGFGVCLTERRAIQRASKIGAMAFARSLTWSPLAFLCRDVDIRPVRDLPSRISAPGGKAPGNSVKVVAVIVSHQPDTGLREVVAAALAQCASVVLVDNASEPEMVADLRALAEGEPHLTLIENAENLGLAAAQNQGIARARAAGADWILLLDDDSIPAPDMVAVLLERWSTLEDRGRVGLLTPRLTDAENSLKPYLLTARGRLDLSRTPLGPGDIARDGVFAIASGSLIRTTVLETVGDMAADYFIDYVDIEFSLRLRSAGFEIVGVGDAELRHRLGEYQTLADGRGLNTHNAWRRRFIHRNRVRVWRAYGSQALGWLGWDMLAAAYDIWKVVRYEDDKIAKLRAIGCGLWSGLSGRA